MKPSPFADDAIALGAAHLWKELREAKPLECGGADAALDRTRTECTARLASQSCVCVLH
jgi:hypothetical protein